VTQAQTGQAVEPAVRVSTLELFFDLVFVFTVTQLTAALVDHLTVAGLLRVFLMLGVIWWMYGGYAWLTNAVAPTESLRRGLLFVGMAGFFVVALAIPHAFAETGWAFGLGYFVVNLVHSGLFLRSGGPGAASAMRSLAPLNLASAGLVLAGGVGPAHWRTALWVLAFVVQAASPYLHPIGGFHIEPAHFVERHGLVVIIALGESVVAIGVGALGRPLDFSLITVAVLGLMLAYLLWWTYFGGDDERAEQTLAAIADPQRRARAALRAYGYAHYPLLMGIVVLAAGVKTAIGHGTGHLSTAPALALGGGVALFLLGDVAFRRGLRIGRLGDRTVAGLAALATVPVGLVSTAGQLITLLLVLVALSGVEHYRAGESVPS
jgi:low temperature requirement protein LtrA